MISGRPTNFQGQLGLLASSGEVLSADSTESWNRIFEDSTDSEYAQGHMELSSPQTLDTSTSSGDNAVS
jgi:hypothetical protein